jgi:predicted aspartyl protease
MNGHVDRFGRVLLTISVRPSAVFAAHEIQVWIDTGFNGALVLPQERSADSSPKHSYPRFRSTLSSWPLVKRPTTTSKSPSMRK